MVRRDQFKFVFSEGYPDLSRGKSKAGTLDSMHGNNSQRVRAPANNSDFLERRYSTQNLYPGGWDGLNVDFQDIPGR